MVKINVSDDCGNAPKKAQLRDFNIAFVKQDAEQVLAQLADNVQWEMVGDKVLAGKAAVADALGPMMATATTELTIRNVMTHGNVGAVDGVITLADGSTLAFCDVYTFSSSAKAAKIKAITSYVVAL